MANIDKIEVSNVTYNIMDTTARSSISTIEGKIPSGASSENQLVAEDGLTTALSTKADLNGGTVPLAQLYLLDEVTDASSYPVKSNAIYDALATKADLNGDAVPLAQLPMIDKVTDYSSYPVKSSGIYDAIVANTQLIADTVGWSGKNLAPYVTESTNYNVTFKYNNGVLNLSGTNSSSQNVAREASPQFILPKGEYKISCKNASSNYWMVLYSYTSTARLITIEDSEVHTVILDADATVNIFVDVKAGATTNVNLYPMIYDADILDDSFEPYRNTTAFPRDEQAVLGAKNFYDIENASNLSNVSITNGECVNTDADTRTSFNGNMWFYNGSTLVSSITGLAANATGHFEYPITVPTNITKIMFGHAGSVKNIRWDVPACEAGNYILSFDTLGFNPSTVGGLDIKNIMLRLASDTDNTYAPYAMTNRELTEKVAPIACTLTTAGTYTLSATVDSDGNVTYTWA